MTDYISFFAQSMRDMVEYRASLGYKAVSYEDGLRHLDRFIAENFLRKQR